MVGRIPSVGLLRSILPERDTSAAPKRRRQSAPNSINTMESFLRPPAAQAVSSTKAAGRSSLRSSEGGVDKPRGSMSRISQLFRRKMSMTEEPSQSDESDAGKREMVFVLLELGLALCTVDPEMCTRFLKGCREADVATLRKAAGKILSELAPLAWPTAAGATSIQSHVAAFLARHEELLQAQELAGTMSEEEEELEPGTPRAEYAATKVFRTSRTQISISSHSEFLQTQRSFRISSSSQDSQANVKKEREAPRRERKSVSIESAGSGVAFLRSMLLKRAEAEPSDAETTGEVKWAKDGCPLADATVDGWAAQSRALIHKYRRQPTAELNLLPSPTTASNSTGQGVSLGLEQLPQNILLGDSLLMYFLRTHERALLASRHESARRSLRKPSQVRSEDERTVATDMLLEQVLRATQDQRNLRATSSESFLLQAPERSNVRATSEDSSCLLIGFAQDARGDFRAISNESFTLQSRDSVTQRMSSNESSMPRAAQDAKGTRTSSNESFATGVQDFVSRQVTSESTQEEHNVSIATVDEMLAEYGRGGRNSHRARDTSKSPRSSILQDAPSIPPLRRGRTQPLSDDMIVDAALGSVDLRLSKDTPSSSSTYAPRGPKTDRMDSRSSKDKSESPDLNLDEVEREFDPEARWRARKEAMRQRRQNGGEKVTYGRMLRGASSRSDVEDMGSVYTHRSNSSRARQSSPGAQYSFGLEGNFCDDGFDALPALIRLGSGPAAALAAGGEAWPEADAGGWPQAAAEAQAWPAPQAEAQAQAWPVAEPEAAAEAQAWPAAEPEAEARAGAAPAEEAQEAAWGGADPESPAMPPPSSGEEEDMARWRRRREERLAARKSRNKHGSTYGSMVRHEAHELVFASQGNSHSQSAEDGGQGPPVTRIKTADRDLCSLAGPLRSEQEQALIRNEQERLLRETHHLQIWRERGGKGSDDMLGLCRSEDRTPTGSVNLPALPGAVLECRSWTSESLVVPPHREFHSVRRTWTNDSSATSPRNSLRP